MFCGKSHSFFCQITLHLTDVLHKSHKTLKVNLGSPKILITKSDNILCIVIGSCPLYEKMEIIFEKYLIVITLT